MKAMVMSAGKGTRLRPLSYTVPKPMFPIAGKPVIEHTLHLLKRHGIRDITINLGKHSTLIEEHLLDGSAYGININYSREKTLLGTAGGVKKVESFFDGTFLVMSGDGLTDIDLKKALSFHKSKKALGTMVLKHADSRFEYGIALTKKDSRLTRFVEKPSWHEVFYDTVNTGIYIFEKEVFDYIPKNTFYDFGKDLWPLLLKKKKRIFAYVMDGYWTDIGNLKEYVAAQHDALSGKIKLAIPGKRIGRNIWTGTGTRIDSSAKLTGPCIIGNNCIIEKNALIGNFTVTGDGTRIGRNVKIENCTVWKNVSISQNTVLKNCIAGNGVRIPENISVFDGSILLPPET